MDLKTELDNVLSIEDKLTQIVSIYGCDEPLSILLNEIENLDESIHKRIVQKLERTTIQLIEESSAEFQTKLKTKLNKFDTVIDDYVYVVTNNKGDEKSTNYTWLGVHTWGFSFEHIIYAASRRFGQWTPNSVRVPVFSRIENVCKLMYNLEHMNTRKGERRQPIFRFNGLDKFRFEHKNHNFKYENLELNEVKRRIIVKECTCRNPEIIVPQNNVLLPDTDSDNESDSDVENTLPNWLFQ